MPERVQAPVPPAFHALTLPLSTPYTWSQGVEQERHTVLVEDGDGWGEVADPPGSPPVAAAELAKWQVDAETAPARIRCGLVGARLDAMARDEGITLAHLLGSRVNIRPGPVSVNALIPFLPTRETTAAARAAVEAGYTCIKVKSNGDRKTDINRLRSLRNALPEVTLRLDPNGAYHPSWAADHLHDLAQFELDYVEDPVRGRAIERLIGRSPVTIAIDETATDVEAVRDSEARVVIIKPQRVGGPDKAAELVAWCSDHDRHPVVTNSLESAVGRAHALAVASLTANPAGLATDTFLGRDVASLPSAPVMEPSGKGIGLTPTLSPDLAYQPQRDAAAAPKQGEETAASEAPAPPRMFKRRR